MPPPLPIQVVSESQVPIVPLVVKPVPPTDVMLGSSAGAKIFCDELYAPPSPAETNMVCPCNANVWKTESMEPGAGRNPQEQLNCLALLSEAMRLNISMALLPS